MEIVERQSESVHTERHSDDDEQEQDRDPELESGPADEYCREYQDGSDEEYVLRGKLYHNIILCFCS